MTRILRTIDAALDPITWMAGVASLTVAGFECSAAWGFGILGICLLLTPIVPRLLRLLVAKCDG